MVTPQGNFTAAAAKKFDRFALYSTGDQFGDLPLTAVFRAFDPHVGPSAHADYVTFLYGRCESVSGEGCQVPLQVQVWNPCQRNRNSYAGGIMGPAIVPDQNLTLHALRSSFFEDFTRLELYTAHATIVLFTNAPDRGFLLAAASHLRRVNAGAFPSASFGDDRGEPMCPAA